MEKNRLLNLFALFAVLLQPYVVGYMYAQQIESSVIRVRTLPISFQLTDNEQLFPKRNPPIVSEDDVTGVYNDATQTMTLTYHFTSDSTVVSIYRDFNKMLQDTISVTNGTEIGYPLSGYGQGDFIFDIRRSRNDSTMVSVGDLNLIGQGVGGAGGYIGMYEQYLGPNQYNVPHTVQMNISPDTIQYSYNAVLGTRVYKTLCDTVSFAGSTVNMAGRCNDANCYVYLFDPDDPSSFSCSMALSKTAQSYVTMFSGVSVVPNKKYLLLVTSSESGVNGTCTIYTARKSFLNTPFYYNIYDLSVTAGSEAKNIFATNKSDDLQLFVLEGKTASTPGTVRYYSDDYGQTTTYDWGKNPRIKAVFSNPTTGLIVNTRSTKTSYNSNDYYTNIYAGCEQLNVRTCRKIELNSTSTIRENLLVSAKDNGEYESWDWVVGWWHNCGSPQSPFHEYHKENTPINQIPLVAVDSILATQGYKRIVAGSADAVIDAYGKTENGELAVKNAAIRTYYAPNIYGYAWESKLGKYERVFHPRNGLGDHYGSIIASYVRKSLTEIARENSYESIVKDYVFENAQLTDDEMDELFDLCDPISSNEWDIFSFHIYDAEEVLANTIENDYTELDTCACYQSLLQLCQNQPAFIYEVYLEADEGSQLALKLIQDLVDVDNHPAMQAVRERNLANRYVGSGANMHKLRRTAQTNAVLFIKELLAMMDNQQLAPRQGITYSNDEDAFVARANDGSIDVEFSLTKDATVSLCVATPNGSMIDQQIGSQRMEQGDYSRRVGVGKAGVYVVSYVVNGRIYNKKVIVK